MPDAKAIIRIGAMPDSSLRRALGQAMSEATRAGKQSAAAEIAAAKAAEREKIRASKNAERAAKEAAQAAIKAAQQHQRQVQQSAAAEVRATQAAARAKAKEAERLAREQVRWEEWAERLKYKAVQATARAAERAAAQQRRESERTARQQIRDAQRAGQARQEGNRRMAAAAGGAALGVGAGAVGRVRSFAGTFGARSSEDMAAAGVDFKRRLAILGDTGGMDATQRDALEGKILQASGRTGVGAIDILAGLEQAQGRFSDLQGFAKIIDQLADVSVAAQTDVSSVVGAMGVMRRQMKLTDDEMQQLIGAMVTAAGEGSIELEDFAKNFASALGSLGRNANLRGLEGAIQALALSQVLGMSDKTAPEAATLATNLMSSLSRQTVREAVALPKSQGGFGVRVSENGKLRDLPTVIRELAESGFMDPRNTARRNAAMPDQQAREAMEVLVTQFMENPVEVDRLLNLSPEAGAEDVRRRVALANEGVLGQAATLGARQFQTFMESGEFDRFLTVAVKSADSLTQLEAKYPLIKEAVGIAADALKGLGAAILAERLIMGGGSIAGAAGVAGRAGATVGGAIAGGAAAAGTIGVGGALAAAGAGLASYGLTTAALDAMGIDPMNIGSGLYDALHYESRSKTRGIAPRPGAPEVPMYSEALDEDFVSREPVPWSPAPPVLPPMPPVPQPQASLLIKVQGAAQVMTLDSDGYDSIDLMSVDTGRRSSI